MLILYYIACNMLYNNRKYKNNQIPKSRDNMTVNPGISGCQFLPGIAGPSPNPSEPACAFLYLS